VWLAKLSYEETPQEVSARSASAKSGATAGQKTAPPARQKTAKFLKLAGYAYSSSEDLTACVGRFIKSLKANRAFYDDFKNIAVEDLKEDRFESQEVMYFKIVCAFKDRD
jgi:hypothetical protein